MCGGNPRGSYISTGIIAIGLFLYNWGPALACLWGVPAAFALLFGSRGLIASGEFKREGNGKNTCYFSLK